MDTGDSALWINSASNSFCQKGNECASYGTFDPRSSATNPPAKRRPFFVEFISGDKGSGIVYNDQLTIGSTSVKGVDFGLVTSGNTPLGNIGLGYYRLQDIARVPEGSTNTAIPTFTQVLMAKNIIKLEAYSIFLNRESSPTGSIIFGGVDAEKFSGKLSTLPVQKEDGVFQELLVRLLSVSYTGKIDTPSDALLDTGSPLTYLQKKAAQALRVAVNAEYDEKGGNHYVSCELKGSKDAIKFSFDGKIIKAPLGSFVLDPNPDFPFSSPKTGEVLCGWGIITIDAKNERISILGTNFLRNAYVVFDLSNNQISIAQASYSSSSRVIEIPHGGITALDIVGAGTDQPDTSQTAPNPTSSDLSDNTGTVTETNEPTLRRPQGDLALLPGSKNMETQSTQQTTNLDKSSQQPSQSLGLGDNPEDLVLPSVESFSQPPAGQESNDQIDP